MNRITPFFTPPREGSVELRFHFVTMLDPYQRLTDDGTEVDMPALGATARPCFINGAGFR